MKATLAGRVNKIERTQGFVQVAIDLDGSVEGAGPNAKEAKMQAVLQIRGVIADDLKFGDTISVVVSTSEKKDVLGLGIREL